MKKNLFLFLGFILFSSRILAEEPEKMGISQLFELALHYSETIPISEEQINAAQAKYGQVMGILLPQISVKATEELQDTDLNGSASLFSSTVRRSTPEVAITYNQIIFHGLREVNGLKIYKAQKQIEELNLKQAQRLLYEDVANSYYTILTIQDQINTTEKVIKVSRQRLGELKKRVGLGKTRQADIAFQATELDFLQAELAKQKADLSIARDALNFLTGVDSKKLELMPVLAVPEEVKPLDEYMGLLDLRADVLAAQKKVVASKSEYRTHVGLLFPKIDVEANYYPYRVGIYENRDWDVLFTAKLPLFNWQIMSEIKESKAHKKIAELESQNYKRKAQLDLRKTYDNYLSAKAQLEEYKQASENAKNTYGLQVTDYNYGLATNLDVLQAQRAWLESMRMVDNTKNQAQLNKVLLFSEAGVVP